MRDPNSETLTRLLERHATGVETLAALVSTLRPGLLHQDTGAQMVMRVIDLARTDVVARAALRTSLLQLFVERRAVLLFATSGIFPVRAWLSETVQRLAHRLLPEAVDEAQMHSAVHQVFRTSDARWLQRVPAALWQQLIESLRFDEQAESRGLDRLDGDLRESLRIVAHRVAAESLDPELLRLAPELQHHASPFISLCEEALRLVQLSESGAVASLGELHEHVPVLLEQCRAVILRVRRQARRHGASFQLTTKLCRTSQQLDRLETLTALLPDVQGAPARRATAAHLFTQLLVAECRRNDLRRYWAQNVELVALRVTENASRSGEHYITRSRPAYFTLLRAAAGGGFIVAWMAALKFLIARAGLPPLVEILASSLNYGLGFVLIHVLHFAVATKQPAMTANAIAAAIGESESMAGRRVRTRFDSLIDLVARTVRSQLAAIVANIGIAVPTAILIAVAYHWLAADHHFVDTAKAAHTLHDMHPFASAALIYAAFAGVCLFVAGLVAGYFDNYCAHNRIPERLRQLTAPKRLFGPARWARFTRYVGRNMGALAGNFLLGFLLGGTAGLGLLLGLPIDVRHVTLAAAQVGFSVVALDFHPGVWPLVFATLGILLIGITNLLMSFYLAIWVGLKSRGITFALRRQFVAAVWERLRRNPRQFLLPPAGGVGEARAN